MLGQIKSNCKAEVPLTGSESCMKQEGKVSALIVTGLNALFPAMEKEFINELDDDVSQTGVNRIYPVKNVVGMTINGGDINAPDLGTYGGPAPTNLNAKNVAYQINAGDCMYKELAKFNRRRMRIFRVDDEGYVYGTLVKKEGDYYFAGFECTLYTQRVPTDGSTAYNLSFYAYYTPNNEDEEKNMHAINVGLVNIPDGLLGIMLKNGPIPDSAFVVTQCGGDDITSEYGDKWKADMFLKKEGNTNPASVTYNADGGYLVIAAEGQALRIATSAVLKKEGIFGLEGVDEYVTINTSNA